jgi:hypothetical protein
MVDDLSDMSIGVLCSTTVKLCLHTSVLIAGSAVHMHTTASTKLSTSQHSHLAPEVIAELWVGFQETPRHWLTPVLQLKEPKAIVSSLYRTIAPEVSHAPQGWALTSIQQLIEALLAANAAHRCHFQDRVSIRQPEDEGLRAQVDHLCT